ncbi:MAG TPA: sulfotransferase, partial [Acidimicrobiales bacterium]|nr:sulfotransferase [Acidimicrobiales bacterium]
MTARPIFVVGYERSGTTLLQAMLGAHPDIAAPPELHYLLRIVELRDYYGDLSDDDNLRRAVHDTLNPPLEMLAGCGFEEETLFDAAQRAERSYRALLQVVMDDFARRQGKGRWSEKTPGQTARAVLALCPDAQVVHIVRDPRDVVASALEAPWSSMPARLHAENWRAFVTDNERVGKDADAGTYLRVRYEDLSADPDGVLRDVTAFLGEPFRPEMIDDLGARRASVAAAATWQHGALDAVDSSRAGTWQHRLTWRTR